MAVYINTEKMTKLETLIKSGDIDDKSIICIYDKEGKYLLCGNWFEDKILEYGEKYGKAWKKASGYANHRVNFQLA